MKIPMFQRWEDMISWLIVKYGKQTEEAEAGRLIWQSWISQMWRERCSRMYGGKVRSMNEVLAVIRTEVVYVL
ncbi:unnamed protein product, partial [Linum tenue]